MAYGVIAAETIQSGTAGQPPQFKDSNGIEQGELCRAWVNFNGTGTVAIRASFNVSSITDVGVGTYRANFTNAMIDANHAVALSYSSEVNVTHAVGFVGMTSTYAEVAFFDVSNSNNRADKATVSMAIFR